MRTEIDPINFAVKVFNDGALVPFLYQPNYPNGDLFSTIEEADLWANAFILSHIDETAPEAPLGKNFPGKQRNYIRREQT